MGAKAPSKLKLRRPTYKCDNCPKKFLSTQALKSHQQCVHKIKAAVNKPVKGKSKLKTLLGKAVKKESNVVAEESKPNVRKKNESRESGDIEEDSAISDVRRIEFECPQCPKTFNVYFYAVRHIQKFHCHNTKGETVPPDSPDLIKPLRVELCFKCGKPIRNDDVHYCSPDQKLDGFSYACTGCNKIFSNTQLFDHHVAGVHCDVLESLFFSSTSCFFAWKENMEKITNAKYLLLGKCNLKQMYRCTCLPMTFNEKRVAYMCPASIVVREYSKGIQVHFYKQHSGHPSPIYEVPHKFKKYVITPLMQKSNVDSNLFEGTDETDLYVQFKTLMDSIVLDAAKLKISALQILFGKALEMTTLLNSYDADESENMPKNTQHTTQHMTEDQITKALETMKTAQQPKYDSPKLLVKSIEQLNNRVNTPKIVNTFSLASEDMKEKSVDTIEKAQVTKTPQVTMTAQLTKTAEVTNTAEVTKTPPANKVKKDVPKQAVIPLSTVPSFNDSYKDYLDKNFSKPELKDEPPTQRNKPVLRNKPILQNNLITNQTILSNKPILPNKPPLPNKSILREKLILPENPKPISKAYVSVKHATPNIDKQPPIDIQVNTPNVSTELVSDEVITAPELLNNLLKVSKTKRNRIVKFASKKTAKRTISKKVVKTKIGQFKPSLSPKNDAAEKRSPKIDAAEKRLSRISVGSASKVDIKYEVKEQENDCNILILKI